MNLETLSKLPPNELVELAGKSGVQFHPSKSTDKILKEATANPLEFAKLILEAIVTKPATIQTAEVEVPKLTPVQAKRLLDAEEAKKNTAQSIEAAIKHIKERQPKFESKYDENTWHFKCMGAEDSGNICIPIRKIVGCANIVSRGRLALMGLTDHFEKTTAGGNSAYTNAVLT